MEAAHITWRPLGQLFVERGLITQDELEEALVEQRETRKRLGAILVSRGLVSGPELTSVLVDQLGMELTKESGFGSGLWDEIRRRHPRGSRTQPAAESANGDAEHGDLDESDFDPTGAPVDEPQSAVALVQDSPAAAPAPEAEQDQSDVSRQFEAEIARHQAELAVAHDAERAELQAALSAERAALESALAAERKAREEALAELVEVRADAGARTAELGDLAKQVAELRTQIELSTAKVAAEREAVETLPQLEERVAELQAELEAERTKSRHADTQSESAEAQARALASRLAEVEAELEAEQAISRDNAAELEQARGEASVEAKQLRESLERLRGELDQLDAATAWFEFWSGAASPGPSPK